MDYESLEGSDYVHPSDNISKEVRKDKKYKPKLGWCSGNPT